MTDVLLCLDLINDIMDPSGKLAGAGYPEFARTHGTLEKVANAQKAFRSSNQTVLHVRVGFSESYIEHPAHSPLLGAAKQFKALGLDTWATAFLESVAPEPAELVITKHRVNAFHGTDLDVILRAHGVTHLYVCGVATDLAVQSTVRAAHDLDYVVTVLSDCCIAATDEDHEMSLPSLAKLATVTTSEEISIG